MKLSHGKIREIVNGEIDIYSPSTDESDIADIIRGHYEETPGVEVTEIEFYEERELLCAEVTFFSASDATPTEGDW